MKRFTSMLMILSFLLRGRQATHIKANPKRRKLPMKRLIAMFAGGFAVLILTSAPAQAQYLGCLESSSPYTLEVNTTSSVALTMLVATSRGRLDVEMIRVFDQNSIEQHTFPRSADRVIFMADAPVNGSGVLKITQGARMFQVQIAPHAAAVIDLKPGPICTP